MVVAAGYDELFQKLVVGTSRDKLRDEFFAFDTINTWEVVQTGPGQAITLAGVSGGSRYLNIATGTAIGETIIQSRAMFKCPIKLAFALSMSQRIAGQEVFVELVSANADGIEVDATFPSTNFNNATNASGFKFDGVTAANAIYSTRGDGCSELASGSVAFATTVATGVGPNFFPAGIWEMLCDMEETTWQARSIDSLAGTVAAFRRTQNLIAPALDYKIRIRVRNIAVAASSTDVRIHFVRMLDTTRFTVDFARNMGRVSDIADSLPVSVANTPAVSVSSIAAGANLVGDVGTQYRANATGAASRAHLVSAATTNPTIVKAAAGRLLGWYLANRTASWRYVKLHNQATAPTAGTGVFMTIGIPPGAVASSELAGGIGFATGIALTTTALETDADATAVGAGDIVGDLFFA